MSAARCYCLASVGFFRVFWALLACLCFFSSAQAALIINSVSFTSTSVPSGTATISVKVSLTSTGSTDWQGTRVSIGSTSTCIDTPDHTTSGTYEETFNMPVPEAAGSYTASFVAYTNDSCGSSTTSNASPVNFTVYPVVSSIVLADINPNNLPSVRWTVTFSDSVTGVDAGDFALVSAGLSGGPQILSVSGNGDTYTVTAATGSSGANGSLGLNLVDDDSIQTSGIKLGGPGAGNGNFSGPAYTINTSAPTACYTDDFSRTTLGSDWVTSASSGSFVPSIVNGRLRLTDNNNNRSTVANLQRLFPGAGNKIIVEFDDFAYSGNGADGIAVTLSDASIAPIAGAFGGSLGYAQKIGSDCTIAAGCPGFAGGWLGVGLDEYGGYATATEGRIGGATARSTATGTATSDAVSVRGSGSGLSGYVFHKKSTPAPLNPGIETSTGYRYRITVDHSNNTNAWVTVDRDTTAAKTNYTNIISQYDAKAQTGQKPVPQNWFLSFTGSTGSLTNIHEIDNLKVCTTQPISTPGLNHVRIIHDGSGATCSPETVTLKACADAACNTLYLGPVTVNLTATNSATWSPSSVSFSAGQTQVTLTKTSAATVKIGGIVTTPAGVQAVCYNGATAGQCDIVFAANSCTFDAVEVGKAAATPIYTKVAGTSFKLDVLALPLGSTDTRTVNVDLVDQTATASGVCSNTVLEGQPANAQTYTFNSSTRRNTFTFSSLNAGRDVRVRIRSGTTTYCSSDNFAIRPAGFTADSSASNANATGGPVFKAGGTPFSLTATARNNAYSFSDTRSNLSGYTGTATINQGKIAATLTDLITSGSISGTFSAGASLGAGVSGATGSNFLYSEVGAFHFLPWAVYDDGNFAAVDRSKATPECWSDNRLGTNEDPPDPNVLDANQMYGCYFGNPANSADFGRFIPDHFEVAPGSIANRSDMSCAAASSFTYMGEEAKASFIVTAKNASGGTTQNYNGQWAKLGLTTPANLKLAAVNDETARQPFPACGTTPAHPCVSTPKPASGTFSAGSASVVLPFNAYRPSTQRVGPYKKFKVGVAPVDSDGVSTSGFNLDTTNVTAVSPGDRVYVGMTDMRYGRLTLANANGSELLDLPIAARVEYWDGSGFILNTDDSCTNFTKDSVLIRNQSGGLTSTNMPANNFVSSTSPFVFNGGKTTLKIKKPLTAPSQIGSADICVDLGPDNTPGTVCQATSSANLPYLQGGWGGAPYDDDPVGRATFGVYKSGPVIYLRELY